MQWNVELYNTTVVILSYLTQCDIHLAKPILAALVITSVIIGTRQQFAIEVMALSSPVPQQYVVCIV